MASIAADGGSSVGLIGRAMGQAVLDWKSHCCWRLQRLLVCACYAEAMASIGLVSWVSSWLWERRRLSAFGCWLNEKSAG